MNEPIYFPNPIEDMKNWSAMLRSGQYEQTKSKLADQEGYCCLGVLAVAQAQRVPDRVLFRLGTCLVSISNDWDIREDDTIASGWQEMDSKELPETMGMQFPLKDVWIEVEKLQSLVPSIDVLTHFSNGTSMSYFEERVKLDQQLLATLNDKGATFKQIADVIDYAVAQLEAS